MPYVFVFHYNSILPNYCNNALYSENKRYVLLLKKNLWVLVTEQTIQCTVQRTYISTFILITRYVRCRFSDWRLMFQKIRNSGCTDVPSTRVTSSDIRTSHYTRWLGTFFILFFLSLWHWHSIPFAYTLDWGSSFVTRDIVSIAFTWIVTLRSLQYFVTYSTHIVPRLYAHSLLGGPFGIVGPSFLT